MFGGGVLLAGCGGGAGSQPSAGGTPTETHPPIGQGPGTLNILEWPGYEAGGTTQTYGMLAGTNYTDEFGADGLKYTYIVNDTQAVNKARQVEFDLMPLHRERGDYVNSGLVQPWDTSLLPSYKNLNPALTERGVVNGQQYFIPWDWGYASILYRTDMVDAAATGWELFWNRSTRAGSRCGTAPSRTSRSPPSSSDSRRWTTRPPTRCNSRRKR